MPTTKNPVKRKEYMANSALDTRLLMRLLVFTESLFFLALIMAFVFFSLAPGFRQQQLAALDLGRTGAFTLVLFSSSFTYWRVEASARRGATGALKFWLLATIALGTVFLLGQAWEFHGLFGRHIDLASNTFGTSFFTLTGFHGLHVFVGLVILSILAGLAFAGDYDRPASSIFHSIGIYSHFVDIVWAVVFTVVYVLPHFSRF